MANEPLKIIHLEAPRLKHLLEENIGRGHPHALQRAQHLKSETRSHIRSHAHTILLLLVHQQQPLIGLAQRVKPGLPRLVIRPLAGTEEIAQVNLALGIPIPLLSNPVPVHDPVTAGPGVVVDTTIGAEEHDKTNHGQGDDNHPQPRLMLSNGPKHRLNCNQERETYPALWRVVKRKSPYCLNKSRFTRRMGFATL